MNEDELYSRLAPLGFHAIEPSELPLEEQISAFSGAEHVVAVAGAALTNIAFCRPGTRVVSLAPAHFPDTFFWFVATHRGIRYTEVRGDPVNATGFEATADFRIRESDIEWLEELHRAPVHAADMDVVAHIQHVGDVHAGIGEWVGAPGSGEWIEGFSVTLPAASGSIQYRAVLGKNWLSPWVADGTFCGSRGVELPLHGLSVRLEGDVSSSHECLCNASFLDGTRREGVPAGELCAAESLAPLEAFQIVLRPKRT